MRFVNLTKHVPIFLISKKKFFEFLISFLFGNTSDIIFASDRHLLRITSNIRILISTIFFSYLLLLKVSNFRTTTRTSTRFFRTK